MNNSPSQTPESNEAAPVTTMPLADAKPGASANTAAKAEVAVKALKTPTPAKSRPTKPVAKVLTPTPRKPPAKAKVKATPVAATAKPEAVGTKVDKARSPAEDPAKADIAAAEVPEPAASQARPLSGEKKAKATKHAGKKAKLVRDSFTFPAADYALIGVLKQRALKVGFEIKKSELMRAGLLVLSALSDATLIKALGGIDKLKP
ncbi:hypothetical protein [Propionivibrio sp.]|uniref:hypothetical protein n=1 Tax=Propionivibrio sp. TaxID=2212460 RepID=UPI003BF420FD